MKSNKKKSINEVIEDKNTKFNILNNVVLDRLDIVAPPLALV